MFCCCCYWISGVTYTVCLSHQLYDLQIFSPILCIPSLFYQYYLLMHIFKIFMKPILSIFSFVIYAFGHIQKNNDQDQWRNFPLFSSGNFTSSGLTFKSSFHFELILLNVIIQFLQYCFLKRLSLSLLTILGPHVKY